MAQIEAQVSYEADGGDPVAAEEALRSLVSELDLSDARVKPVAAGPAPEGARADAATVQAIVVAIPAVLASVQTLVNLLQSWKRRREGLGEAGRLKVQIGNDVIELDDVDDTTKRRLVETWLAAQPDPAGG